jgi:iron(III) transport system substrate-binding protein
MKKNTLILLFSVLFLSSCFQDSQNRENIGLSREVNLYTDRHYPVDDSIFRLFEREYGIRVNVVKGDAQELLARLDKEGATSKADMLITTDIARIYQAKEHGFFQPVEMGDALKNIPSHLYDDEGIWFGLTKRARIIVVSKERIADDELMNYEDLADPKYRGRIAMRSKENVYNQSMLASIIAAIGEEEALSWVKGVVTNLYQSPKGNDRDQVKAIFAGQADASVVNTYYLGKMMTSDDPLEVEAVNAVRIVFPNQSSRGTHINVSGAGVLKHAVNREEAQMLLSFLLSHKIQQIYADGNFEYPVLQTAVSNEIVRSMGDFKEDELSLNRLGALNTTAIQLFDRGGWK